MPFFTYIGGGTASEHEGEGVEMPDSTTAFGTKFIVGLRTEITQAAFGIDTVKYEHAVRKLRKNKYFREDVEDASFEMVAPEKAESVVPATVGAAGGSSFARTKLGVGGKP